MTEGGTVNLRSDARRNRVRVLAAARAAFAAEGRMVALGEIARRAGVGAGTVYRHFPSKEELFEAVIAESVAEFVAEGRELAADPEPVGAFFHFVARLTGRASHDRALGEALAQGSPGGCPPGPVPGARREFREFGAVLGELLGRAQRAGGVRADVTAADVRTLLTGCAAMERGRPAADTAPGLLTAVMCDGLRAGGSVPGERETNRGRRDATRRSGAPRGEPGSPGHCEMCGDALPTARTGRPARFCSAACRQRAHRRRIRTQTQAKAETKTETKAETENQAQARPQSRSPVQGQAQGQARTRPQF